MASKRESRDFKLSFMPWRPGLVTAGQETTSPEDSLRKAKNANSDLDGMIQKRPGIEQWGQTLKKPDPDATDSTITSFSDFLSSTGYTTDGDTTIISVSRQDGTLKTNEAAGSGNETRTESYVVSALSANTKWSLRFMFRGLNLPDYGDTTNANSFVVRARGASGANGKEFGIWSGGLYYKQASDSKYVLIIGSEFLGAGSWHAIEIQSSTTGNTLIYVDEVLLLTIASTSLATASFVDAAAAYEFEWEVEGSGDSGTQYSTRIATPMYNDTASTPFTSITVVALHDYQYLTATNTKVRTFVAAAGDYIYHDKHLEGAWRPLHPKSYSNVFFAKYRTTLVWSDNNGAHSVSVWQWDGRNTPELLDDFSATKSRFLVEHQKRLLGWGDVEFPRRLYYSGDRLPNVAFSPRDDNTEDEFDTLIDAGYVEIESWGIEVRAVIGDYQGLAIIAGEKGYWKLSGSGVFSYRLDGSKVGVGAVNAYSHAQIANDVWSIGTQGLVSLAATDQFGDLQAAFPSVPIQDLWSPNLSSPEQINQTYIAKSSLHYSTRAAVVYIMVPLAGDRTAQNIYTYNTNTKKFLGPWEVDCQAAAVVEAASPVTEVLLVGGTDGQIGYFNTFWRKDFIDTEYTFEIETSGINGRSLDPRYVAYTKTWKTLRLFIIPRGDWDFTIKWWTDEDAAQTSVTRNQNNFSPKRYVLDKDFKLDLSPDGLLASGGELSAHEFALDRRGRSLYVNIQQPTAGYDLAIQGIELEGTIDGIEVE